jgi:hypothetical protein
MLRAKSNKILLPSGAHFETPLLVPSFSSKGFSFNSKEKKEDDDISEVYAALEVSREFLTESVLLSAYDLHYGHIPFKEENFFTELTFVDSGGYETASNYDFATVSKYNYDVKGWSNKKLVTALNRLPESKDTIIVSYDHGNHRVNIKEQINAAENLFSKFPKMLGDFLIKPETRSAEVISVSNVIAEINSLKKFLVIGITERELGNSILNRMLSIAQLKEALNNSGNHAPIHIFGSLDPITSILYFLAGAEIFDGLTWLKYSYDKGAATYQSNYGITNDELGIHTRDSQVKYKSMVSNVLYLAKMKIAMKNFSKSEDYNLFDDFSYKGFGKLIEKNYNTFESHLK